MLPSPCVGDGSRVLVTTSVEDVSSTLTIVSVQPGDAGSYSCTGTNGAGASTRATAVIVLCELLICSSGPSLSVHIIMIRSAISFERQIL